MILKLFLRGYPIEKCKNGVCNPFWYVKHSPEIKKEKKDIANNQFTIKKTR